VLALRIARALHLVDTGPMLLPEPDPRAQALIQGLLEEIGASRVTLRRDAPGDYAFPVVEEALAPGVGSLRDEYSVHLPTQPVVLEIQKGNQVVQHDSRAAFADPDYQRMLEVYGGMRAQIVTPIVADGTVRAIISIHQLGAPRTWTEAEIALATATAARVKEIL
jgi:GAF domain-containing protein